MICPRHHSIIVGHVFLPHLQDPSDDIIHEYARQREESVKKAKHSFVPSIHATVPHVSETHRTPLGMDMEDGDAVAGACFSASLQSVTLLTQELGLSFTASLGCP
ncbi:hypothetical protein CGRA01v4_05401 [Colletotrichum graminicola]|nr:hypothetical protein CGRA01v4_05401 [Colletotrichum graminicola]